MLIIYSLLLLAVIVVNSEQKLREHLVAIEFTNFRNI